MTDGIVSGDIQLEGVPEAIRELELVKARIEDISKSTAKVTIDQSGLQSATDRISILSGNLEAINAKVAQGTALTVNDIKSIAIELQTAYEQLTRFQGRSNEATAAAERSLTSLLPTVDKILQGNAQVEASAAALSASSQARLEKALADAKARAEASDALKARILSNNAAQIASNDALAASFDRVAVATNGVSSASTRQARTLGADQPLVDYRSTQRYQDQIANSRADEDRAFQILPTDDARVIQNKQQAANDAQLVRVKQDAERRLEDNPVAKSIQTRAQIQQEQRRIAAEFDAGQAQKDVRSQYYQISQPVQAPYASRYRAGQPSNRTQEVEAQFQAMLKQPIDPTILGAPNINAAVSQRTTEANRWRSEQIAAIKAQSDKDLEYVQKAATLTGLRNDQAVSDSYIERGFTNIAVGGDPIVPITQATATRRNRTVRNPALGSGSPASAALGGGAGRMGSGQRMPIRGGAANRYGRSFAPPIIPQAELDANFEAQLAANPPSLSGELTPRQIYEAQLAADTAKAQPALLNANRQAIEDRIKAYGQSQEGYNPFATNAQGKVLLNPVVDATATAGEAKKETAVISEEAGKQWEIRRQFLDKELADSKATWQAAAAERDKLANTTSQAAARATTLTRRAASPNANYSDERAAAAANANLADLRAQLRDAQDEARNAKYMYEEVGRASRQQNRQDAFSAEAEGGGPAGVGFDGNGNGGRRGARSIQSIRVIASSADDAETQMRALIEGANNLRANGGRINLNIEATGGFETEGELRRIANAAFQVTGPEGRATVHISSEGGPQTLAQMEAVAKFNQDPHFANINFQADTSGSQATNRLAQEAQAANRAKREDDAANTFASREAAAIQKQSLLEEAQYIDDIKQKHKEATAAAKEQAAATAEINKQAKEAATQSATEDANRNRPFTQTANTQSRSILGVPAALAAPVALGVGVAFSIKEATDYNSLLIKTANQTNLTTSEIDRMNQTIRDTPSGSPNLADLASGYKNITDLGYGAADAQAIATEESKAATAAGSAQATVMLAITSSMKDYNAEASDVAKFTNTTVEAARLANSTFENWSSTTRRATAIAAAYRVPLAEVDAMLVALTRHGFNTAQANTQVAGLIQNIVAPTPAAQREIKSLSQRTGIDLVGDFSQQGLAAKTTAGVLDDLARATNGDEAEIRKLIPALRGGQAALLLTTNASDDFKQSLQLLQSTVDGSLKPVDDGFNRISHTIGYQAGTALKGFKLDLIDIGQGFAPVISNLLEVINKMPPSLQQTVIAMTLVSLASKAMAIGLDFVQASATKYVASEAAMAAAANEASKATAEGTAVTLADNTALIANTELVNLNALSLKNRRMVQGLTPVTNPANAAGVETNVVVDAAEVGVAAGFGAKIIGAVGSAAAALGTVIIPVTIGLAVGKILADTVDPTALRLLDAVLGKDTPSQRAAKNPDVQQADQYAQEVSSAPDPQEAIRVGKLYLDTVDQEIADYKSHKKDTLNPFDSTNQEIDSTVNALMDRHKKIQTAVDNRLAGLDPTARKKAELTPDEQAQADQAAADQAASDTQNYQILEQKRTELLAKGAPERLVNVALYPDDFADLTTQQVDQAKKDLVEWERQYGEVQTAAKAAQTALQTVDLSKGLSGLNNDADKLKLVNDGLTKVGQTQSNLSGLASIAGAFKDIQDAEDLARTAYDGFLLTLDETDRRVSVLQSLRQKVTDAVAAAQAASDRGTANDQDRDLLAKAPDIFGNIDQNIASLKNGEVPDILGLATNLPKYKEFDDLTRSTVARFGGGTVLEATLHADVTEAESAIQAVVDGPWNAYVNVHANTNGTNTPPAFNPGNPSTTAYDNTNGNDPTGMIGSPTPSLVPGNGQYTPSGGPRFNSYRSLSPQQYSAIVREASGDKPTPFDDPAFYSALVTAAQLNNVDPRALLAFAKYENSDGANISQSQNLNNNFSGIKFAGQSGASAAEISPEGDPYARFDSPLSYFDAFAKNLSTGAYAADYQGGDLAAVRRRYVAGSGPVSDDQLTNINNTVSEYYRYLNKYPADPGATGGPGHTDYPPGMDPEQVARYGQLGTQQTQWMLPVNGYTITQGPFSGAGNSHQSLGAYDLAVPNGTPIRSVATGTVVESGYSDAGYGNTEVIDYGQGVRARYGHLSDREGVKVGDQVAAGQEIGLSGSTGNSTGPHLHFEVTVNGKETDPKSIGFNFDDPSHQGAVPSGVGVSNPGSYNATNPADPRYKITPMYNAADQARLLAANMMHLNPQDQQRLDSVQSSFATYTKQNYEAKPEFYGNKTAADNAAESATLNFAIVYARTLGDIRNHTGNIAKDYKDLQATGGALANNAIQWLQAQEKIDQTTQNIQDAQDKIKAIDDAAFSRNISRAQDDQIIAAKALNQSRQQENDDINLANKNRDRDRKIQDQKIIDQNNFDATQRGITVDTNKENDAYAFTTQRRQEDKQRALQFNQQVGSTDLQNQITNLQKAQADATFNRTSQEQLVSKRAESANTNEQARVFSGQLAIMHEGDLATKDANKKALDDLQLLQQTQAKKDSLDMYSLQTETLTAQRAHEDAMHQIDLRSRKLANSEQDYAKTTAADDLKRQRGDEDAAVRLVASRLQIKRDDEDAAVRLANRRATEDQADAVNKKNLQDTIDQNTKLQKSLTEYQGQLDGVAKTWSDISASAGATADPIIQILIAAGQASGNPVALPVSGFGNDKNGTYSRRLGSHAAGTPAIPAGEAFSIVGDGPGGQILQSTELLHAPGLAVTNLRQLLATPPPPPSSSMGGNVFEMPINLSGDGDAEAMIAQLHVEFDRRLRAALDQIKFQQTNSLRNRRTATGR